MALSIDGSSNGGYSGDFRNDGNCRDSSNGGFTEIPAMLVTMRFPAMIVTVTIPAMVVTVAIPAMMVTVENIAMVVTWKFQQW